MKKQILALALAGMTLTGVAQQLRMPQPSPAQTIKQDFAMGTIELSYSRPGVKSRTVFGDLVPWGQLWRTGANAATRIKFNDPVIIGGVHIDTGTYVIYTIPQKNEWEIILNKGNGNMDVNSYKKELDVVRVKVPSVRLRDKVETFTMQFENVAYESCELHIKWENTAVVLPIRSNVKDRLKTQMETALAGDRAPYWQAANFYYEWEQDYAKALENVNAAIEAAEKANQKPFYMYMLKARIQKAAGDNAGAKASAEKTIQLSTEVNNKDYIKLATDLLKTL
ncbi:MAG TPA: DUF2911 domain-containing protein [Parasegetibacter sp.]